MIHYICTDLILLVSDKKLSRANRKGDKPFGKSPKIGADDNFSGSLMRA